jgi:MFS family permease
MVGSALGLAGKMGCLAAHTVTPPLDARDPSIGPRPGTAAAALAQPEFRRLYIGGFASNIGSWAQMVVLGPFALAMTKNPNMPHGSGRFAAIVAMAQLGPLLLFAVVGGTLAARIRTRTAYMIFLQTVQLAFALMLAWVAMSSQPSKVLLVVGVAGGGVANAFYGPLYQTILPEIVGRENIPGAVSLGSAMINGSRVIGPILLALTSLAFKVSPTAVFLFNAVTFLAVIWAVFGMTIPPPPLRRSTDLSGVAALFEGFREMKRNPIASRVLSTMFWFSLLCLPFVAQFPKLAEQNMGVNSKSTTYLVLFGVWGTGALCGSLSLSTIFASVDKRKVPNVLLLGFAVLLAIFGNLTSVVPAYVVGFALGFCYFGTTTALNTVLQQHLDGRTRGPVMAIWFMCFGGTVPFAGMWGGQVMDKGIPGLIGHGSATFVLMIGAVVAVGLALRARLVKISDAQQRSYQNPAESGAPALVAAD